MNLEEKNVKLKIANWTSKIGEIAELKIANGQSIARIAELKNEKKYFWVENKELKIATQHNLDFSVETSFSIIMLVYKFTNHRPHQRKHQKRSFL